MTLWLRATKCVPACSDRAVGLQHAASLDLVLDFVAQSHKGWSV
jgi:hypothetical protein